MGLTIHYAGSIRKKSFLSALIDEVRDICEVNKWEYQIYETEFPTNTFGKKAYNKKVYGIMFSPHDDAEPVHLTFLSNGRMSSEFNLNLFSDAANNPIKEIPDELFKKLIYQLHTKTQYAGSDTHKIVVHLMKHLEKKYLRNFKLYDEGHYWETLDEKLLDENFDTYTKMINAVTAAFENNKMKEGETIEEFLKRTLGDALGNVEIKKVTTGKIPNK